MYAHTPNRIWPAILATGLLLSGCLLPVPPPPTLTPAPTLTASTTASPVPSPTATLTPTPSATPTPSPTPGPVCTIEWGWRNEGLVVTRVDPTRSDGLFPGDLVLTIDGRSAEEVIVEVEINFAGIGDPELRRQAALDALLFTHSVLILRVRHHQEPLYYYNLFPDCH